MSDNVVAVIPAHNESDRIEATVRALVTSGRVDRVIVVDDGSSDDTSERARQAGADVLVLTQNVGKTKALCHGVEHARARVLLLVDADLGDTARHTLELLDPVLADTADMTIAAFPHAGRAGGFGVVKGLASWLIRRLTGATIRNPLSGQRALGREVWECWRGSVGYGFEVALTIDALRAKKRVMEIPLPLSHRHMGRSLRGFMHRARQLMHILLTVGRRYVLP